jgi:AbrB family looped-hinge helix DNA binding protein
MATARIRERGQVTIPAEIRRQAHLEEGSLVELEIVDDGVLLRPRMIVDPDTAIDAAFARTVISTTVAGYEALRSDPALWDEELRERDVWSATLSDGLDE